MDYILFCKNYFLATGIPVSLLDHNNLLYATIGDLLQHTSPKIYPLYPQQHNPCFERLTPDLEYGHVHVDDADLDVILGPIFNIPASDELVLLFMREQMLPRQYKEPLTEFFFSMPVVSHFNLLHHLSFLYLSLNRKSPDMNHLYSQVSGEMENFQAHHLKDRMEKLENASIHNTYVYEIGLYECIKAGNEERLLAYLNDSPVSIYEGKLAFSPLRQAKNFFISVVQKAGLIGAIPGGVEIEKTYQLMDHYIQECEKLQNLDAINQLLYAMLLDFCRRAGETHIPDAVSADVFLCMSYIRTHPNEPVTLNDVAAQIGRSTSYIMKKFKKELGIHVGAYITRCKLEEAKSMLVYTEKSLSEISSYLCFSSQSYFQNVFKKQYGMTPMQYRKSGRKL